MKSTNRLGLLLVTGLLAVAVYGCSGNTPAPSGTGTPAAAGSAAPAATPAQTP